MNFIRELINSFAKKNQNDRQQVQINKDIQQHNGQTDGLIVYAPKNIPELNKVIDCTVQGQTVIVNMSNIKTSEYDKVVDYLCGALYALNADINCLQNSLYIITPKNVKISTL